MKLYFSNFEITGDIKPDVGAAYDLGTATRPFRDLYLTPDSIKFIGAGSLGSVAGSISQASFENKLEGTGLVNYVPVWTGGKALTTGNLVYTQQQRLGVNKTSPSYELDVGGTISGNVAYFSKIFVTGTNRAILQLTGSREYDPKAESLASRVFINSGASTDSLEQTGVRTNTNRIKIVSGFSNKI